MSVGAVMIGLCLLSGLETSIIGFDLKQIDVTHYWEKGQIKWVVVMISHLKRNG